METSRFPRTHAPGPLQTHVARGNSASFCEPDTRLRVRWLRQLLLLEGATRAPVQSCISSHSEREGEAHTALPGEGATRAGVQNSISSHSEREGVAPTASAGGGGDASPFDRKPSQEFHLTPRGWISGTSRVDGSVAGRLVERPPDAIETWLEEMVISYPQCTDVYSWTLIWFDHAVGDAERKKVRNQFPPPSEVFPR
ncbi:MAG: hypothetical protein A4E58_01803 [Syntrophorhabdus sp. PtaB.Bin006]|nr:MAG: hypothetical protein A4E58_01803 [Syntrophorhabdus sp. PtaB.Bin006]